jgi:membrane fusion protein, multidrug efflux system
VDQARRARDSDQASVAHKGLIAPAEVNLGYAQIKAPFDGIVIAHFVSIGEPVGTSGQAKLATLVQIVLPDLHCKRADVQRFRAGDDLNPRHRTVSSTDAKHCDSRQYLPTRNAADGPGTLL